MTGLKAAAIIADMLSMRVNLGTVESVSLPLLEGAGRIVRLFSSLFQTLSERKISEGMSRPRLGARSTRNRHAADPEPGFLPYRRLP